MEYLVSALLAPCDVWLVPALPCSLPASSGPSLPAWSYWFASSTFAKETPSLSNYSHHIAGVMYPVGYQVTGQRELFVCNCFGPVDSHSPGFSSNFPYLALSVPRRWATAILPLSLQPLNNGALVILGQFEYWLTCANHVIRDPLSKQSCIIDCQCK